MTNKELKTLAECLLSDEERKTVVDSCKYGESIYDALLKTQLARVSLYLQNLTGDTKELREKIEYLRCKFGYSLDPQDVINLFAPLLASRDMEIERLKGENADYLSENRKLNAMVESDGNEIIKLKAEVNGWKRIGMDNAKTARNLQAELEKAKEIIDRLDVTENQMGFCEINNNIPFDRISKLREALK